MKRKVDQLELSRSNTAGTENVLIMDCGTGFSKIGYAGDDDPKSIIQSSIEQLGKRVGRVALPNIAKSKNDIFPIKRGIVSDWEEMEKLWSHLFTDVLQIDPEGSSLLLTEAPQTSKKDREKTTQIMFESYQLQNFYLQTDVVLPLYAAGRTCGTVVSSGEGITHIVPVYEGFALKHAMNRIELAGCDVNTHLKQCIQMQHGCEISHQSIVNIKEKLAYVSQDFKNEHKTNRTPSNKSNDKTPTKSKPNKDTSYSLPDGTTLSLQSELCECTEILFQPGPLLGRYDYHGFHTLTYNTIMKTDVDIRAELCSNIVLSGGNMIFNGIEERMASEISKLFAGSGGNNVTSPVPKFASPKSNKTNTQNKTTTPKKAASSTTLNSTSTVCAKICCRVRFFLFSCELRANLQN